jgi:hypothetical protein
MITKPGKLLEFFIVLNTAYDFNFSLPVFDKISQYFKDRLKSKISLFLNFKVDRSVTVAAHSAP